MLHTWGQCLQFHPHIHSIVPNGAVDPEGNWILPRKNKHASTYIFPVKALSEVFRGKLLHALERLYQQDKLIFPTQAAHDNFPSVLKQAASKRWQVYAKKPFAGREQVLLLRPEYSHFPHRVRRVQHAQHDHCVPGRQLKAEPPTAAVRH